MRLIPLTIAFAAVMFTVKVSDIFHGTEYLADASLVSSADAQTAEEGKKDTEAKPAEAPPAEGKEPAKEPAKEGEAKPEKKKSDNKNKAVSSTAGETVDQRFTKAETELLQNLARRRDELDRWERNIQIKEIALDATEKRVSEKIDKIEAMQKEVSTLLAQYNTQEDAKIRSLVKIYESMKPADAARIFDEIEMPILLLVIDKMSEKKAAPILAQMDSRKAKQITVELAAQRRISSKRVSDASSKAK